MVEWGAARLSGTDCAVLSFPIREGEGACGGIAASNEKTATADAEKPMKYGSSSFVARSKSMTLYLQLERQSKNARLPCRKVAFDTLSARESAISLTPLTFSLLFGPTK